MLRRSLIVLATLAAALLVVSFSSAAATFPITIHAAAASDDLRATAEIELTGDTVTLDGSRAFLSEVTSAAR